MGGGAVKTPYRKIQQIIVLFFSLAAFFAFPRIVEAASFYFTPSSGTYALDSSFSVNVYVASADQSMNAASGVLSFPKDKLNVTSVSKGGSVFNLWVAEPTFSNSAGSVNFEGVVLNPGYTGSGGKILTINFKAKAAGTAEVRFSSGSVLANDGEGTNILTNLGSARFTLGDVTSPPAETEKKPADEVKKTSTPSATVISSPTHPDPNKWYTETVAKFTWTLPRDVTAARLLFDKDASGIPVITYTPAISEKEVTKKEAPNVDDGVWYFHVQLKNANGWGAVAHFRVQLDTQKPTSFTITEVVDENRTEPGATFEFSAEDATSGIDHYEVSIDDQASTVWRDDGTHHFVTDTTLPGTHTLAAKAVDKAGNWILGKANFVIEVVSPPTITGYPRELQTGEPFIVRGTTYPDSQVTIFLAREGDDAKSYAVQSSKDGKFVFVGEEQLREGSYRLWADATNAKGIKSVPSEKLSVSVVGPAIFRIGAWLMNILVVIIPILALSLFLLLIIWYARRRYIAMKKQHARDLAAEPEAALFLQGDIRKQIKMLVHAEVKRELTREEIKLKKQLARYGSEIEKMLKKKSVKRR